MTVNVLYVHTLLVWRGGVGEHLAKCCAFGCGIGMGLNAKRVQKREPFEVRVKLLAASVC